MNKTINEPLKEAIIHACPNMGNNAIETAQAYHEAGMLKYMMTTILLHNDSKLVKWLIRLFPTFQAKFKSRNFDKIPLKYIKTLSSWELIRIVATKLFSASTADTIWEFAEKQYDNWVGKMLKSGKVKIIHGYEHSSLQTFKIGTKYNVYKVLEKTSLHYSFQNKMLIEQLEKYPSLNTNYTSKLITADLDHRNDRKAAEMAIADLIICNSTFTKKSLIAAGINKDKILTIPLAYPTPINNKTISNSTQTKFLYAGNLQIGKGTHILIETWKAKFAHQRNMSLTLVGTNGLPKDFLINLPSNIKILDFVTKEELNELYDQADIFVFPTLSDGFGMVITEALARGLPVIATRNCAGPDLIEHEVNGLLMNADDSVQLAELIRWCHQHPDKISEMSKEAIKKAKNWQWADYRSKLIEAIIQKYQSNPKAFKTTII